MTAALQAPGVALKAERLIALRRVALASETAPVLAPLPGGFATKRKGRGLEVADIREYVAGDDIRHLDRGATARTGRLHVRQFQEERDRVTLLVADFRPSMFWGLRRVFRSVAAAEALSLIGWNVVENAGRVGLLALTPGEPVVVPARGRTRGMLDVIGGMVDAHETGLTALVAGQTQDRPLDQALSRADRIAPVGSELVIASGFDTPGDGLGDRLDALARRRTPRLILVTDADASRMPGGRYPVRLADGRRLRLRVADQTAHTPTDTTEIAGRIALSLDAGDDVERLAQRISSAFHRDRTQGQAA